jgi:hypothetical protein
VRWSVLALVASGCNLFGSLAYPTLPSGEAAHVAVSGSTAYLARGETGVEVYDVEARARVALLPPPPGARSSDHLCVADGKLFVLDARRGRLSVYSAAEARAPKLVSAPVAVPVGPFSGVSAGGGRVIVSGGTSELTVLAYDDAGRLGAARATADLGRGQPEVRIAPDGTRAVVSTHFSRPDFGVTTLLVRPPPEAPVIEGRLALEAAGFTPGGFKPANFPLVALLDGDRLFAAYGAGLAEVDLTRPAAPRLVRVVPLDVTPVSLSADGSTLAIVGSSPAPRVVLVDMRTLAVLRSEALPADAKALDVALTPSNVVIAAGPRGALVLPRRL